jgi:hypothetical protein
MAAIVEHYNIMIRVSSVLAIEPFLESWARPPDSCNTDVVCRDCPVLNVPSFADTRVGICADCIDTSVFTFRYASTASQICSILHIPRFTRTCVWRCAVAVYTRVCAGWRACVARISHLGITFETGTCVWCRAVAVYAT